MEESPATPARLPGGLESSRFLKYTFFKVAREWRSLEPDSDKEVREGVPPPSAGALVQRTSRSSPSSGIRGDTTS